MVDITNNAAAVRAAYYLNINSQQESSALSKLSSGSRITAASDDASGLAIASNIGSGVTALQQAATNAAQANSILQTADGGASNIIAILTRMKALASQSASGTVTDPSRVFIADEFTQLTSEIDSIAGGTRYNSETLLDANSPFAGQGVSVLVGTAATDTISIALSDLRSTTLFGGATPAVDTQANATAALATLDTAIGNVSAARANIGAQESRFNFSADSIQTQIQNLGDAKAQIVDVDVAAEQAMLSSAEVKTQAAVSAEAAANQMPQFLLKLLG